AVFIAAFLNGLCEFGIVDGYRACRGFLQFVLVPIVRGRHTAGRAGGKLTHYWGSRWGKKIPDSTGRRNRSAVIVGTSGWSTGRVAEDRPGVPRQKGRSGGLVERWSRVEPAGSSDRAQ